MNRYLIILITFCMLLVGWTDILSVPRQDKSIDSDSAVVRVSIDTKRSVVRWRGTEMRETSSHEGILDLKEGYLEFKEGRLIAGEFVADMNTITVTDIPKSDPVPRRNLREHLESEDFFLVEKYPTARFQIVRTEYLEGDSVRIEGNLSIRDVTNPVSFVAHPNQVNGSVKSYRASFTIDRFEWNVAYQGSFWKRISSIIDNTFVDAAILISVELVSLPIE